MKAAQQGDAAAQNSVGNAYFWGTGVEMDFYKADLYFEKAAAQGNETAIATLKKLRP